jgi:hypothetical protein
MNAGCNCYRNEEVRGSRRSREVVSFVPVELPGSRPAIQLSSSTRGFTLQHMTDRLNLICAQHNLGLPSKSVATLMSLAYEVSALFALAI